MNVLLSRALEGFLRDTYGVDAWEQIVESADDGVEFFESGIADAADGFGGDVADVIDSATTVLGKSREDIMEDLGTYLVSHPNLDALRRLLRFGGVTFPDFLLSLDDLPDRARLAVSDLRLPSMELIERAPLRYDLMIRGRNTEFCHMMVGLIRAMSDDYGSLASIELTETGRLSIVVHQTEFAEAKPFELVSSQ